MSSSSISWLFPISHYESGFTTTQMGVVSDRITQVSLSDSAVGVHKSSSRLPHKLVEPPAPCAAAVDNHPPRIAWEAFYPKGSINPSATIPGGFGFYMSGPPDFAHRLESAREALFSYRVMFEEEWEWVKGGKLPGIFGGVGELSYHCSGGREDDRCKCFSLRLMWRGAARGELYAYIPLNDNNTKHLLEVPPESHKNPDYGFSVGRGAFKFPKGAWTTVAERVKLNNVGQADGEIEVWINGTSVIKVMGLVLRDQGASHIKGMHFQTFFGGNKPDWASPKDQKAWFADVSGAIIC